jgi:hypothetical protein
MLTASIQTIPSSLLHKKAGKYRASHKASYMFFLRKNPNIKQYIIKVYRATAYVTKSIASDNKKKARNNGPIASMK